MLYWMGHMSVRCGKKSNLWAKNLLNLLDTVKWVDQTEAAYFAPELCHYWEDNQHDTVYLLHLAVCEYCPF